MTTLGIPPTTYIPFDKNNDAVEYYIHDNGGHPFSVNINHEGAKIYAHYYINDEKTNVSLIYTCHHLLGYWPGVDDEHPQHIGNSVLIDLGDQYYLHVSSAVFIVHFDSPVLEYRSPIGRNDITYPFAFTADRVYSMCFVCSNETNVGDPLEQHVALQGSIVELLQTSPFSVIWWDLFESTLHQPINNTSQIVKIIHYPVI